MNKQNKKDLSPEAKKKQLLFVFQQQIPFLQIFSQEELTYLDTKLHVFVFSKGQMLAREKEVIDYVGVIVEGRAVARTRSYQIGDIIGSISLLGYQQHHLENIPAESDGVIIALRIHDFHQIDRIALKNKIYSRLLQLYSSQLLKRQQIVKTVSQFEQVEQKKVAKYLTPEWTSFFSNQIDLKDKIRFLKYFPFLKVNQKDLIINNTSKPYLIYVVQGQIIAKSKPDSKIIQAGKMYNLQGFIFDQTTQQNIYCLSSQATILMIDRSTLSQMFKTQIFRALMKITLAQLTKINKKQQKTIEGKEIIDKVTWNIFKKYPNTEILPLPKKIENNKTQKSNNYPNINLTVFQSLFRDQLGNQGKVKTVQSVASSGYDKLFTMKTQSQGKEMQNVLEYEKIKKQAELLSEKFKKSEQERKAIQLDLIQHKSRGAMHQVHKQIKKLYQQDDSVRFKMSKTNNLQNGQNLVSLKIAFDKQLKENKLQMLVAKCAFKWLFITRKRKTNKKE